MSALKKFKIESLCQIIARNVAYYRVVHPSKGSGNNFWRTVSINFINTAVLDWCKIFAEEGGKHHWQEVIPSEQHDLFFQGMISSLNVTGEEFLEYVQTTKAYRNQFVAHLDDSSFMPDDSSFDKFPDLELLFGSTKFLYVFLYPEHKSSFDERYVYAERSAQEVAGA